MAMRTPPSWLQNGSHPAENDRLSMQALYATTGVIGSGSLAVTAQGTPNMTVNVASGWAAIVGTTQSNMGTYVGFNDATTVLTVATAPSSNSRIDLVCMTVNDAYYSGSTNNVVLQIIAGTVASSPVAPTLPANSISLATIAVGTSVTSIGSSNITDTRTQTTTNLPVLTASGTATFTNKTFDTAGTGNFLKINGTQVSAVTGTGAAVLATSPTLTSPTLTSPTLNGTAAESIYYYNVGFAGYSFYTVTNGAVQMSTQNATANGAINITAASGTTLASTMAINTSITITLIVINGATAYYPTSVTIDGSAPTVIKWQGGTAPSSGNANSWDIYTFEIQRPSGAWYVLASQTKFA